MRPLCCGMRSHPYLSSLLFLSQCRSSFLYLNILPAGCLSSLLYPNFYLDLWWARLRLFRGNAAYMNLQTARTAAGRPHLWTPCRENALPPPRPRMLYPYVSACARAVHTMASCPYHPAGGVYRVPGILHASRTQTINFSLPFLLLVFLLLIGVVYSLLH